MRRKLFAVAVAAVATFSTATLRAADQDEKAMAQQVATVLRDSGKMKAYSIGVKFKDGTAWLSGRVTSKEQAAMALQIVSNIDGVDQIVNNLTVGPAPATSSSPVTSGRKAQPVKKPAEVQYAAAQEVELPLAAAEQPLPQKRIAKAQPKRQAQPRPMAPAQAAKSAGYKQLPPAQLENIAPAQPMPGYGRPIPAYQPGMGGQVARATYDQAHMPNYAWPSYAAHPNYAALTYPKQYSASAWPFIGPFYPYPQVPLGWRRVSLEWDDGWWFLDFDDRGCQ